MSGEAGTLWQQISRSLADEIEAGLLSAGARLPADVDLAARFGVNRHTVRRAVAHLQTEGLLRGERGRGTYVVDDPAEYRLGPRTRFTENLLAAGRVPGRQLLGTAELPAPAEVARHLGLELGDPAILAVVLGEADGAPLSLGRNHFPAARLPGLPALLRTELAWPSARFSITGALRAAGVASYRRAATRITARLPTPEEARHLRMPASQPVLETESLDVDDAGNPLIYACTAFRGAGVQLVLET